jgi:hypothetical protein
LLGPLVPLQASHAAEVRVISGSEGKEEFQRPLRQLAKVRLGAAGQPTNSCWVPCAQVPKCGFSYRCAPPLVSF